MVQLMRQITAPVTKIPMTMLILMAMVPTTIPMPTNNDITDGGDADGAYEMHNDSEDADDADNADSPGDADDTDPEGDGSHRARVRRLGSKHGGADADENSANHDEKHADDDDNDFMMTMMMRRKTMLIMTVLSIINISSYSSVSISLS